MWACRAVMLLTMWASAGGKGAPANPVKQATFQECRGRAFTPSKAEKWRHRRSSVVVLAGDPHHSAQDIVLAPSSAGSLSGKFTYGPTGKDIEDEKVHVWLDDCSGWRDLGEGLTDDDGRMSATVPGNLGAGVYEVRFQVLGDGSTASSYLWLLPAGTRVVVTDIDATLTKSDAEVFKQILDGDHVPVPYPGAVDLASAHAGIGHVMVYLTGRPYWLADKTRAWLTQYSFPAGPVHVADSNTEILPTEGSVGAYKRAWLDTLVATGYTVDFAYGNAKTDVSAYNGAGIPSEQVWIIGKHGGSGGSHAVVDSWLDRVTEVRALPAVVQPFLR
jgi:phosphatidate phosphatase PAH1